MKPSYSLFTIGLIMVVLLLPLGSQSQTEVVHDFEILTTENETKTLSEFTDKPILLEWGASWCGVCKENQENMETIYNDYKENVTFITLSYGWSGDDINDVQRMKDRGPHDWLFGLDINKYSSGVDAANGHMWVLNADLTVFERWGKGVLPISELRTTLAGVQGLTGVFEPEVETLGLEDNPLFIGFIAVMAVGTLYVVISKLRA